MNGQTHVVNVNSHNNTEIRHWVDMARTRSGTDIVRLRKQWHTDHPSIQGTWHPFTFKESSRNVATFPDDDIGAVPEPDSATKKLLKLAEQLRNLHVEGETERQSEGTSVDMSHNSDT